MAFCCRRDVGPGGLLRDLESSLAEAEAVLMSIQLCRDLGLSRIVFEGDAKGVVDGINLAEVDRGWMVQVMAKY
jgi:ribonuclease HI